MCSPRKKVSVTEKKENHCDIENDGFVLEICECYFEGEDNNIENQDSDCEVSLINEANNIEDQDSEGEVSLINETGSREDNNIEDQDSEGEVSLINETGSIEDALEAMNSSWNKSIFEMTDEDDKDTRRDMTEGEILNRSKSKVEAWLLTNDKKLLNKSGRKKINCPPKSKECQIDQKISASTGVTKKRKMVFEDHLPDTK